MNSHTWQKLLSEAITDPRELLDILQLDFALLARAQQAVKLFPLRVPRSFVAKMQPRDPHDPLLRQVLPLGEELQEVTGYNADPLQENAVNPIPGLLHKYYGRVLLTLTGACGVNCRYCFRREFPYSENNPGKNSWEQAVAYIAADPTISEVILSGGDPLIVSDVQLQQLIDKVAAIAHVTTLRIHTRMPIVLPERITQGLIQCLTSTRLRPVMVLHCNHPNEIDAEISAAMQQLRAAQVTLLNQSVLLCGVNDSIAILCELSKKLFSVGILPYYLHTLDKVRGAAHFSVTEAKACELAWGVAQHLPGYLVPKLVKEEAGQAAKIPIRS